MTFNGRTNIAMLAKTHGWTMLAIPAYDGLNPNGNEIVAYQRSGTQILIEWTPQLTAVSIIKNLGDQDEVRTGGPLGLVTARNWLEEPAI